MSFNLAERYPNYFLFKSGIKCLFVGKNGRKGHLVICIHSHAILIRSMHRGAHLRIQPYLQIYMYTLSRDTQSGWIYRAAANDVTGHKPL